MNNIQVYNDYERRLDALSIHEIKLYKHMPGTNHQYMVVEFYSPPMRDYIDNKLRINGILSRRYFNPSNTILGFKQIDDCLKSKYLSDHLLCLPTGPQMKKSDVMRVCNVIAEGMNEFRNINRKLVERDKIGEVI